MANIGDEIKDYIAKIASSSITNDDVVANMREDDKKKDAEMANMSAQIKQLTAAVAKLASRENDGPNQNRGRRGNRVVEQMTKLRNMGGYCSTHGFHPVSATHDSATCQYRCAQRRSHMEQPPQWQHLLAQSHPRRGRTADPPNMEKQGGAHLTGTGDERCNKRYKHCRV